YLKNGNIIGTNSDGNGDSLEGNVIASSQSYAIYLYYANNSIIAGNKIGVGADGITNLGGGNAGIHIYYSSSNNLIGGTTADSVNIIANNGDATNEAGIYVSHSSSDKNKFLRNSIYGNYDLGIKL